MRSPLGSLLGLLLLVGVQGCGGEEEVVDDGSQTVVLDTAGLAAADVEVLSPATPTAATAEAVVGALDDAGVQGATAGAPRDESPDFVVVDASGTAGLLAVVADDSSAEVVLVFDEPASAAVFAAGDPDVFTAASFEAARETFLAGNVVAYATPEGNPTLVRRALNALAAS